MLGACRAHHGSVRRGLCGSGASSSFLWTQVFDNFRGGYGQRLVAFVGVLGAVDDALSGGEARVQGAVSVLLARGCSLSCSGVHGGDKGAVCTGMSFCNSCCGQHGVTRWTRGYLLDNVGRPGVGCGVSREDGVERGCARTIRT